MCKCAAKIRQANMLDLMAMAAIAEGYSEEAPQMKVHPVDIPMLMQSYANTILSPDGYLAVLEVDGKIVGGMWGILTTMPWSVTKVAQDIVLFVKKEFRGIGNLLIDDWVQWAAQMGAVEVILSTASGIKPESFGRLMTRKGFVLQGQTYSKGLNAS